MKVYIKAEKSQRLVLLLYQTVEIWNAARTNKLLEMIIGTNANVSEIKLWVVVTLESTDAAVLVTLSPGHILLMFTGCW